MTHVVVAFPTWSGRAGVVRFEVYSPDAPDTCHACISHEFCSEVPQGVDWGCLNFYDQRATERAIVRAWPSVTSFRWIGAIVLGVWPEVAEIEARIAAAKERVRAVFVELQAVEAERNNLVAPRVLKDET